MHQLKLFKILIEPSPLSLVVILITSILWVTFTSWPYFRDDQLIHQYFFGPGGITTYTWEGSESIVEWAARFFSSTAGYYVLLTTFGLFVGVAVFTLLQTIVFIVKGTAHFLYRSEDAAQPAALFEIFTQLWVRCLALVGWAWFTAVTIGSILPLLELLVSSGANYARNYSLVGGLPYVQALLLCMVTMHIHVVFARLLLLRPRIFGSNNM